jgi:hypothetical protein
MSDDLAARARERARENEVPPVPEDWGKLLEIPEDGDFVGRYLADTSDERWDPPRPVFLLVDSEGERCWIPGRYRLVQEMQRVKPGRGADIAVFRDFDIETKNGTMHVYGVEAEPNDAPLSGDPAGKPDQLGDDEDMPF